MSSDSRSSLPSYLKRATKAVLTTLVLVAALGTLAELAQIQTDKDFSLTDLYRDIAGAALYLCARILWQWTISKRRAPAVHFSARLVSIALGALLFVPLGYWLSVTAQITANYPSILDFDGRWDSYLFRPVNSDVSLIVADQPGDDFDGTIAELLLLNRDWSGLKINPMVSDWSSFQFLTMRAAIVGAYESKVLVYLSDGGHPGYSTQHRIGAYDVGQQPIDLRFPLRDMGEVPGRPNLDPSNIMVVYIIGRTKPDSTGMSEGTRLFLDNIRLE